MSHAPGERQTVARHGGVDEFVLDPWTALSFKRTMGDKLMAGVSWTSPNWAGDEHWRRLLAYKMRHSYYDNAARHFLPTTDTERKAKHREYGDAALIVETVRAALMGNSQEIVVPGSDKFNLDTEEFADDDLTEEMQAQVRAAAYLEDDLRRWSEKERFQLALVETERNAVKLADGVYVLGWSERKKRPLLAVYDPGFYFPVLETVVGGYPTRVHIAWEVLDRDVPEGKTRVHRMTWELREVEPYAVRWADEPVTEACFFREAIWDVGSDVESVDDFTGASLVRDLTPLAAEPSDTTPSGDTTQAREPLNLQVDYIPVVHLPNTVALSAHYGASVLDHVLQILDDIANADTDLQNASALAGMPPIAVGKARLEADPADPEGRRVLTYGPGTAFEVGEGTLTALDMSSGLVALIAYVNHLLSRLEVNARVPAGILGRVKPSEVPSGVALALSFGPLSSMIDEMRLVREDKYRILLRFVTRYLWANDQLTEDPPAGVQAELKFGSYLPVDRTAIVEQVSGLLSAKAISRPTALLMLTDAGVPIEDAARELAAIQAEDFEGASALFDATDDPNAPLRYLGLEQPAVPAIPEPVLPPLPPTPET